MSDVPDPINEPILETSETKETIYSTRGLNQSDFYLITFDESKVVNQHMQDLVDNLVRCGIHFSLIPVVDDPSKAIYVAETHPKGKGKEEGQENEMGQT